ncbi:hypothetical protein D3C72_2004440 [compost metagenome]
MQLFHELMRRRGGENAQKLLAIGSAYLRLEVITGHGWRADKQRDRGAVSDCLAKHDVVRVKTDCGERSHR